MKKYHVLHHYFMNANSWLILENNSLYSVSFSTEGILKITNNLDCNKAHGHDKISIWMFKL